METSRVLVYRNELLPRSETFILSQANALRRFQPVFGGLKRVSDGLDLGRHLVLTLSESESWIEKALRRIFLRTGCTRRLTRTIAAQSPRIIHAHFAIDASAVLPIAKRLQVPLIVTLHGYDVSRNEEALNRWPTTRAYLRRKKELWEYATTFVCVSEHVRRRALSLGFPERKVWVHRIGVEPCEGQEEQLIRDEKTVLFVGRLVEKKGCIYLIRAMPRVLQAIPEARLVIAGDGPLRKTLESEAALHCRDVIFLGYQPQAAVRKWMRRARVLAAPSVQAGDGDSEGLPTVLCEAQAERLPVIAFATEGVTEALPVERRKLLPKAGDVAALAEEIICLMKDDRAWQQASAAGRDYIQSYFDLRMQTKLLEDKYEEVIAGAHG
jgi:glycosyltransferase involved in cell wall biosynthesis